MEGKIFLKTSDGIKLCGIWNVPKVKSEKAIILAHGITSDKDEEGIFSELTQYLKNDNYSVFRFDFRGHGESGGKQEEMTIAGELIDLSTAVNEVRKKGYSQIGLLGASFGGGISVLYVSKHEGQIKCLCLWNPVLNYDHVFINPITAWLGDKEHKMGSDIALQGWTEIGSSKYRLGEKVYKEMEEKGTSPSDIFPTVTIPKEIIHSLNDTYVPYQDSLDVYKKSDHTHTHLFNIENAEHGFQNEEVSRRKVLLETLRFFNENL